VNWSQLKSISAICFAGKCEEEKNAYNMQRNLCKSAMGVCTVRHTKRHKNAERKLRIAFGKINACTMLLCDSHAPRIELTYSFNSLVPHTRNMIDKKKKFS
jgi:hypothetical protein